MWNYWININSMVSRASATFLKGQKWEANAVSIFSFKMEVVTLWSFIVGGIASITKNHFLFREIPLTLQKSKPRAIRFEVSTDGRNEKRKPCMSATDPSLGINETRVVVHWNGWRCQMEHMPNLSPNNILTSNICNLNGIKPNQIELSKEAIFVLWGPYFTL